MTNNPSQTDPKQDDQDTNSLDTISDTVLIPPPGLIPTIGRPPKYSTAAELDGLIEKYLLSCWQPVTTIKGKGDNTTETTKWVQTIPYTITGLGLACGLSRKQLIEYSDKSSDFRNTISRGKQICEAYANGQLFIGRNPSGAVFDLLNNYKGWRDRRELDVSGGVDVRISPSAKPVGAGTSQVGHKDPKLIEAIDADKSG